MQRYKGEIMEKILLTILLLFSFSLKINAQITTGERPIGFDLKNKINFEELPIIKLMPPDLQKVAEEDKLMEEIYGYSNRFAYPINANFNINNSGYWKTLEDGSKLWTLDLVFPNALSTSVIYNKFWLPEGTKFFIYNQKTLDCIGAITSKFIDGTYEAPEGFSTGIVLGENVTFEYYQPAVVKGTPIIEISRIDYGYRFMNHTLDAIKPSKNDNSFQQGFNSSGKCQVNINCSPEGDNWQEEKKAIVRILIKAIGGTYWCSGALINNTKNDFRPYVLTADHCLREFDALDKNDLKDWIFYWHYEHPFCNNSIEPTIYSTQGATLVANNYPSDFALLELKQDPRNINAISILNLYYLGWDASGSPGTGGVCIHHPSADVKKIATYNATPIISNCMGYIHQTVITANGTIDKRTINNDYWKVNFIATTNGHSVIEGCSSGSPLINSNRKIIGQLFGPGSCSPYPNCSNKNGITNAGKFNVSWNGNTNIRRQLKYWLDPASSTNQIVLNGIGYCPTTIVRGMQTTKRIICKEIILENATVPSGIKLELIATDKIIINSGVVIQNGGTLELEADGSVIINDGYTVEAGATFIIK